jgi:hypothetical protein
VSCRLIDRLISDRSVSSTLCLIEPNEDNLIRYFILYSRSSDSITSTCKKELQQSHKLQKLLKSPQGTSWTDSASPYDPPCKSQPYRPPSLHTAAASAAAGRDHLLRSSRCLDFCPATVPADEVPALSELALHSLELPFGLGSGRSGRGLHRRLCRTCGRFSWARISAWVVAKGCEKRFML